MFVYLGIAIVVGGVVAAHKWIFGADKGVPEYTRGECKQFTNKQPTES